MRSWHSNLSPFGTWHTAIKTDVGPINFSTGWFFNQPVASAHFLTSGLM